MHPCYYVDVHLHCPIFPRIKAALFHGQWQGASKPSLVIANVREKLIHIFQPTQTIMAALRSRSLLPR